MKFTNSKIEIDRELSDLDIFAIDFIRILEKYTDYVIVSGYVVILLGRSRATEDIDVIIPKIEFSKFQSLLQELTENGFYCLNAERETEIFEILKENMPIRFAKKEKLIPNIEFKLVKSKFDELSIKKSITIKLPKKELNISNLELQIAFKEAVLRSDKDLEDARHIRNVAEDYLDNNLIQKYKEQLNEFFYKRKSKG